MILGVLFFISWIRRPLQRSYLLILIGYIFSPPVKRMVGLVQTMLIKARGVAPVVALVVMKAVVAILVVVMIPHSKQVTSDAPQKLVFECA